MKDFEKIPGISLSRITPPPSSPENLNRASLLNFLEGRPPRALMIMAPAGFGKTVLASQWAELHKEVIWYTASAEDSPRDTFLHIVAATRRVYPGFAGWVDSLLEIEFDPTEKLIDFCNEMGTLGEVVRIVFHDVDELGPHHAKLLTMWRDNAPNNVLILSIRSSVPEVMIARTSELEVVRLFTAADLKLSEEEVQVLAEQNGLNYKESKIRRLLASAEGWPAGVQILLRQIAEYGIKSVHETLLLQAPRYQQLVQSALDNLDTESLALLEAGSLFDEFSLKSLEGIPGITNALNSITKLSYGSIYIKPADESGFNYSISSLMKPYLIKRLEHNPLRLRDLGEFAAQLFENQRDYVKALRLYSKIGLHERARALAERAILEIVFSGDRPLFQKYIDDLENQLGYDSRKSAYLKVFIDLATGYQESAEIYMRKLEDQVLINGEMNKCEELLLKIRFALHYGEFEKVKELVSEYRALPLEKQQSEIAYPVTAYRAGAIAAFLGEDLKYLREIAEEAEKNLDRKILITHAVSLPTMRAMYALAEGRLRDATNFALYAIDSAQDLGVGGAFFPYEAVYCLADVYREELRNSQSAELLVKYISHAEEAKQLTWISAFRSKLALVKVAEGDVASALAQIDLARRTLGESQSRNEITRLIDEHEMLVRVAMVDEMRIGELLSRMPQTHTPLAFSITYAALADLPNAAKYISAFPADSQRDNLIRELISAQIFQNNHDLAKSHLQTALRIATENGFRAIFTHQSREVQRLILEIAKTQSTIYLEQLAATIELSISKKNIDPAAGGSNLTKRELGILSNLASGRPISEIAAELFISQNTIKTHLKNLYRKMGVKGRDEAVTKGRELNLL